MDDIWIVCDDGALTECRSEKEAAALAEELLAGHFFEGSHPDASGWDDWFVVWYGCIERATYRIARPLTVNGATEYAMRTPRLGR